MPPHQQILEELRRYLASQLSVGEFEEWFFPATWNVRRSGDPLAVKLRGQIGLLLAEFDHGHRSETELKQLLGDIQKQSLMDAVDGISAGSREQAAFFLQLPDGTFRHVEAPQSEPPLVFGPVSRHRLSTSALALGPANVTIVGFETGLVMRSGRLGVALGQSAGIRWSRAAV